MWRLSVSLRKGYRYWREARMFARAMASPDHPIVAQIVPIRRCNLACTYCNEYDATSAPVPADVMLRRIDRLAELGTGIVTFSGGEPTLHPDLDLLIRRARRNGAIATLITNGLLLTPDRIARLNRAGLDYLQISIDNLEPDEVSKKSLRALDQKLTWLANHAQFHVTINSVLGGHLKTPQAALRIAERAREFGFTSNVGVLHDDSGQLVSIGEQHRAVHQQISEHAERLFTFSHYDSFQRNILQGLPNAWHCRAGGRFLYICEEGLVHYCSQQRGTPGIPLDRYTREDIMRESGKTKGCAPFCTISCVHQAAMLDEFRERPREALAGIIERRTERDPAWRPPASVRLLQWMFLGDSARRDRFGVIALRLLGAGRAGDQRPQVR